MIITGQFLLVLFVSLLGSFTLRFNLIGLFASVAIPLTFFYPFSLAQLLLSLLLGLELSLLIKLKEKNKTALVLSGIVITVTLASLLFGPVLLKDIADRGVINAQRGEHAAYQTNLIAKLFHNKASYLVYFLDNLVKQLSPSVIFASGNFPNFSKYLPIAYVFPWYLLLFLINLRGNIKNYVRRVPLLSLVFILSLIAISGRLFSWFLVSALVWFIVFESAQAISRLDKRISILLLVLNLSYLFLYILPINHSLYSLWFFL